MFSDDRRGFYQVAQVCLNGHVISSTIRNAKDINGDYCEECGKPSIVTCQKCNKPIPGEYNSPNVVAIGFDFHPPKFCKYCGQPFPWTESRIETLKELIDFENKLSDEEKERMKASIEDIISETPKTQIAAMKFKQGFVKIGKESAKIAKDILIDIVSETAKKTILGN